MTAQSIIDLIDRQIGQYRELLAVGVEQKDQGPGASLPGEKLLGYALRKSAIMSRVEEIDRDLAPVRDGWTEVKKGFADEESRRIEAAFAELRKALERVLQVEELNQSSLVGRMEEIQGSIARTGQARLIQKAYGRPGPGENRFVDRNQ